jgi:flagellar biosynthesis protein
MSGRPVIPLAVALHYEKPGAPRVVAAGRGEIGNKIVQVARSHGVPIEENPGLAEALSEVEVGEQIPVELYRAVAEVLSFILRTSGRLGPRP